MRAEIAGEAVEHITDLGAELAALIDDGAVLTEPSDKAPFLREWRDLFQGKAIAIVQPRTAQDVCAVLRFASERGLPVVPQGGNTGLVGGQTPDTSGRAIVLSLARLNRVRQIDAQANVITTEAGVVLEALQKQADAAGRFFPLSLGAQGSCMIGGNIATNAGGTGVLAYGNTRDLVLGLEVALPDGRLWNGLSKLRKDNTGYDLKNLFIGSEGTLGVITAASLKLFPKPRGVRTAFIGLKTPHDALRLYEAMEQRAGHGLTGFEIMPRLGLEFVLRHLPGARDPLTSPSAWYVLAELSSGRSEDDAQALLMECMEEAFEADLIEDAAVAQTLEQSRTFWSLRHGMSEVQKPEGGSIKHDVSVPVSAVPSFIEAATEAAQSLVPGCRPVPFGHLGDGNIHFNISQPEGADKQAFLERWDAMNEMIHAIVADMDGSISAEHGIGQLKRDLLPGVKDPVALALMRTIKLALDPKGIMNPGKLLPDERG
ncbi:MAG: FAD-binding oxidoreductase [Pseudomonadota bacterium]